MKLVSNKESYGFLGRHWIKGDIVEVSPETIYPHEHFDVIEGETPKEVKPKAKKK